jgi:hypothetical protein
MNIQEVRYVHGIQIQLPNKFTIDWHITETSLFNELTWNRLEWSDFLSWKHLFKPLFFQVINNEF